MGLGENLRAAREHAGLSLSALARRTHYSKPLLAALETGGRRITRRHVLAYAVALGVSVDVLYGDPTDPVRAAHRWLVEDSPMVVHSRAGRRIGASLVEAMQRRVVELRHLDDTVSSTELYPVVHKELAEAQQVVAGASYTDTNGGRLWGVVSELAQLAGWVASDTGRHAQAEHTYLAGVSAARHAGDRVLGAQLLSCLAYQTANIGDPSDAVLVARSAITGAPAASPVVRALLWERLAWSAARARDTETTRRALDTVDDTYADRSTGTPEPEWVYWLNRAEIDVMASRCHIELGDPATAEPLLTRALATYPAEHVRETGLYRTWLAEAYARTGNHDAAATVLVAAEHDAARARSARLDQRITDVACLLD
ncbi:hypothetical protein GCM10012275_63880 [Longimycelium tulufanense]|uniref:HTH cro/C1-type domain-containing protein n=2 Tax=Longimycelium tulufanense TaxID=907463 RepID=A0A8J3FZW0_9PSEU|nr:hypothetical protein GCM10012275_63880 [Longimycelium tulufanense]